MSNKAVIEEQELEKKIEEILRKFKTIAVVGMSRDNTKPARKVPKYLMSKGYRIIPINPFMEKTLGKKAYPNLLAVPPDIKIDIVEVFRPSEETPQIVKQAIERKKKVGDIKVIWLQEGIKNSESRKLAEEAGIEYIEDRCMYKEYERKILGREPQEDMG